MSPCMNGAGKLIARRRLTWWHSYIKELADRINTIEGKLNNTTVESLDSIVRRSSSEAFASAGMGDESRKRPFSSMSGDGFPSPSPSRIQGYTTEHRPILPYVVNPDYRPPNSGNPNDLAVKPTAPVQFPGSATDAGMPSQPDTIMGGTSQNGLSHNSSQQAEQLPELDDAAFDRYVSAPCIAQFATLALATNNNTSQLPASDSLDVSCPREHQGESPVAPMAVSAVSPGRVLQRLLLHGQAVSPRARQPDEWRRVSGVPHAQRMGNGAQAAVNSHRLGAPANYADGGNRARLPGHRVDKRRAGRPVEGRDPW